jgi:cell wall-associated NlpC family hydrolase
VSHCFQLPPAALFFVMAAAGAGCATGAAAVRPAPFPGRTTEIVGRPVPPVLAPEVLQIALNLRGTPYRLGGDRPDTGLDCSGLVRFVFLEANVSLPRTVAGQFRVGEPVAPHAIQPGDLLFFETTGAGPSHVGIALDADAFVHAPGSGGVVRVERLEVPYWSGRLVAVRRVASVGPMDQAGQP